jgi:KDO2-lipid IV(A) lauroyltransferase
MSKILYYVILKPLSLLPLAVTYRLSDFLFYLNYYVIGYRKTVVLNNLSNAFPEKTATEIDEIAKRFFRHFCDLIVEAIRVFSMPEKEMLRRCQLKNPELLEDYYKQGKSVIIIAGHYNNWELAATACDLQIPHQTVGIYKPLRDPFINKLIQDSRMRFGLQLMEKKKVKQGFEENQERLTATLFGADQSPVVPSKAYWMNFLNQDTAVMFGSEKLAKTYDLPVVFGRVIKLKRGYYHFEFETVEDHPTQSPHGSITERHTRILEQEIIKAPQYWLWTHKRWKHKRPNRVE